MCFINNTVGNIHKIFNVVVQSEPKFINGESNEQNVAVKLHHGINLNCKVDGNPEPTMKWIFVRREKAYAKVNYYLN